MTKVETEQALSNALNKIDELEKAAIVEAEKSQALADRNAELVTKIDSIGEIQSKTNSDLPPVVGIFRDMAEVLTFLAYLQRCNEFFKTVTPEWLTDAVLDFPEAQAKFEAKEATDKATREGAYALAAEENRKSAEERKARFDQREAERRAKFHNNEL